MSEGGAARDARPAVRARRAARLAILAALAHAPAAAAPFDAPAGLVVLAAQVDGRRVRLLLDTGDTGGLAIDAGAAARLGLAIRPAPAAAGDRRGLLGPLPAPLGTTRVARLRIDAAEWSDVEALVVREDRALATAVGAPYDGCVGAALLEGRRLVIDYPSRAVSFGAGRSGAGAPAAGAPDPPGRGSALRREAGLLLTEVDLGRGPRTAVVDTASAATFVDPSQAGAWQAVAGMRGLVDAGGATGGLPPMRLERLRAGGATLHDITALALDLAGEPGGTPGGGAPPAAILGADLLSRQRVVIDLAAGRFVLGAGRP